MILVDSSYFIALANKKDRWHKDSKRLASKIFEKFVVTDLIISESVTAVGALGGGKAGVKLYEFIIDSCDVVYVNARLLERSMKTYLKFDGTLSVPDVTSVSVMEEGGIKKIISFDSDFDKVEGITRVYK